MSEDAAAVSTESPTVEMPALTMAQIIGEEPMPEAPAKEAAPEVEAKPGPAAEAAKPEPAKETPREDDRVASKFAALARKERELKAQEQSYAERLAKLEEFEKLKANATVDPEAAMGALGLDYKMVTDHYLADPAMLEMKRLARTVEERTRTLEAQNKELQEAINAQKQKEKEQTFEQTLADYKKAVDDVISEAGDKYKLVKAMGMDQQVLAVSEEIAAHQGRTPSIAEALDLIAEYCEEQRLAIQEASGSPATATEDPVASKKKPIGTRSAGTKTLTNDAQSTAVAPVSIDDMDDDEALAALAAIASRH